MPASATTTAITTSSTSCPQTVGAADTEGFFFVGAGTFAGITGTVQGSYDGTSWFNMMCINPATGVVTQGGTTITLADSTGGPFFRIPNVQGLAKIRFLANGFGSGSCPMTVGSGFFGNAQPSFTVGSTGTAYAEPTQLIAASGAISITQGTAVITKTGSLAAVTLAAPTAGTDDYKRLYITSDTAFAHTVTCPASTYKNGGAAVTIFTFTGTTSGGGLILEAYNGTWKVLASVGGAFS